jgi:hypothetical protein
MPWRPEREAVNHVRAEARPAGFPGDHHRKLTETLRAQGIGGLGLLVNIHHLKRHAAAFHCPFGRVALNTIVTSVNNNAHDSYFHLK